MEIPKLKTEGSFLYSILKENQIQTKQTKSKQSKTKKKQNLKLQKSINSQPIMHPFCKTVF